MTEDNDSSDRSTKRILAVAVLLVAGVGVALAATTTPTDPEVPLGSQSGMTIYVTFDQDLDLETAWPATDAVNVAGVTFYGKNSQADFDHTGNAWTNMSTVDVTNGRLRVEPSSRKGAGAAGAVDTLRIHDVDAGASNSTEVIYSASAQSTLYVNNTGLPEDQGVVAVDPDTGDAYDAAAVNTQGDVVFDEMPSGMQEEVDFRTGPAELRVYRETKPTKLVSSQAGLTFRFFPGTNSETVTEKTVTDGTVDLTGIPSSSRVVITVDDQGTNYAYRRITLTSLTEQNNIYLLNTTKPDVTPSAITFRLDDQTGIYDPSTTVLRIRKPIRKDWDNDNQNETRYKTIAGGNFGSSNKFQANLIPNTRYRLVVTNGQGAKRVLGTYTPPTSDQTEVLPIGSVKIDSSDDGAVYYAQGDVENTSTGPVIRFKYFDPGNETEFIDYTIYNETNNSIVASQHVDGPFGEFQATHNIGSTDTRYRIEVSGERGTDNINQTTYAGDVPPILKAIPLDPKWMNILAYVAIVAFAGFGVIIDSRLGGATAVAMATIFTALGAVQIPFALLSAAAGVTVMFLASTEGAGQP